MLKKILSITIISFSLLLPAGYSQEKSANPDKGYIISPNDMLEISVYGEPDLSTTVKVAADGTINYPLLGDVKVAGLSASELEDHIAELLERDYLVKPEVNVLVKEYAKNVISILGSVRSPGSYEFKEGLTLTKAVALAGGFTEQSNTSDVKINRMVAGRQETIEVDADQILNKKAADARIEPNDTIIVGEYGRITIIGQVVRPGVYTLKKGMTIIEAIGLAGGFTPIAAQNGTRIIRVEDGKKKIIRVPISDISEGNEMLLQDGDVITVPESFF